MAVLLLCAVHGAGCERERRRFNDPAGAPPPDSLRLTTLEPGRPVPPDSGTVVYEENAHAVSEGKRLFSAYNCAGCHGSGGGNIGPALMDDEWRYGASVENIYASIAQGRPNGMPAFGSKVPPKEIWELAAYVRSLGGLLDKSVASGRDDHMQRKSQEQATKPAKPRRGPARFQ
jgi:cytochrome c oxidase cbb3-type subunit 3